MNRLLRTLFCLAVPLLVTSCFEIREDIYLKHDGTGRYEMMLDFSEAKTILEQVNISSSHIPGFWEGNNPFLHMDSVMQKQAYQVATQFGIRDSKALVDHQNFRYGIGFTFKSVASLNNALVTVANWHGKEHEFYSYAKGKLKRNEVFYWNGLTEKLESESLHQENVEEYAKELYNRAGYEWVLHTEGKVSKISNKGVSLSEDSSTVKYRTKLKFVKEGNVKLRNTIKF
ncbi:hypothetical protein V6R21_27430 [Limibacter armeniacum]|uniref:hypothetical protein n=1 Tax=Limibacter armeniacum TaxID=466084 RepID=UPI002FE56CAB